MPLLVWPFARTLFLAFDLSIRPLDAKDLGGAGVVPD